MKYSKYILSYVIAGLTFLSCDLMDQPAKSSFEDAEVFSNATLTRYSLNAIYESYTIMASYRTDYFYYYGLNTDIEMVGNRGSTPDDRTRITQYDITPNNYLLDNASDQYLFSGNMRGIERANICIQGLKEYGDVDNNPELGALYGEALVARALLYIDLMNVYGEVPARFTPITKETIYLPKADKDVLYKQLLSDLETAAKYLSYQQDVITKPGKALANGLYARIALQAAGYSLRPDEGKVNTGDAGTVRKSRDPQLQASVLYPKALKALEDVIEHGNLSLYENFEDLWKSYCNLETQYGKEIIYGLPFSNSRGQHITQNGVPNEKYGHGSGGRNGVSPTLYFRYDKDDTRRDVTCCPFSYDKNGVADPTVANPARWYYGKFRFDWMETQPLKDNNAEDGAKYTYMRYADILLMAAEIANELDDLDKAKEYMKPVLGRAFHNESKVNAYLNRLADKEAFFEAIKDQRAFEFAGEMLRRADLIRWGILKKALDEVKEEIRALQQLSGKFSTFSTAICWRLKENGTDVELYGFNPGETEDKTVTDPQGGWQRRKTYFTTIKDTYIDNIYVKNPDENMYRPIPASIIIANMGVLKNDYNYNF